MSNVTKIRVHGKSQARTALGIINAYLVLNPDTTLAQLQEAFPANLNHSVGGNIVVPLAETEGREKSFFEHVDEQIVLKDGTRLAFVEPWVKDDYEGICAHGLQYGIEIASFKGAKSFQKGSYSLECINGYVSPTPLARPFVAEEPKAATKPKATTAPKAKPAARPLLAVGPAPTPANRGTWPKWMRRGSQRTLARK